MKNSNLWNVAALVVLGISVTNCGSSQNPVPPPSGAYQPLPGYPGYVPLSPSNFQSDCNSNGGISTPIANNGQGCRIYRSVYQSVSPYFRMTADSAYGGGGIDTGIDLRPGDKISWNGQACWYDGSFNLSFTWSWNFGGASGGNTCDSVDQSGYDHKHNQALTNAGLPEGVVGNAGAGYFLLGSSYSNTVSQPGRLRVGINAANVVGGSIYGSLTIARCIDANGNAISCPF